MAKITIADQKIFAGVTGYTGVVGQFGSYKAGAAAYSIDPDIIQALSAYDSGLAASLTNNAPPTIQDLNGLFYLISRQIAYCLQMGIPEWDALTEYHYGSFVSLSIPQTTIGDLATSQSYTTGPDGKGGVIFTPAASNKLYKYTQMLRRNASAAGNLSAELYNTANGVPTTVISTSNSVNVSTISDSDFQAVEFNFLGLQLIAGTTYAVVVSQAGLTVYGSGISFGVRSELAPPVIDYYSQALIYTGSWSIDIRQNSYTLLIKPQINSIYMSVANHNIGNALSAQASWMLYKSNNCYQPLSSYTIAENDYFILTPTSGVTISLPIATTTNKGREIIISSGTTYPAVSYVDVTGGSQTIDGSTRFKFNDASRTATFISNGSNWFTINNINVAHI